MLISGVGVTAPLYASQVFSTISGVKKGYVTCVHLMVLVVLIGHFLKGMHVGKIAGTRTSIEIPGIKTDTEKKFKTDAKDLAVKDKAVSAHKKNAALAVRE